MEQPAPNTAAKIDLIVNMIRLFGGFFILLGLTLGLDVAGLSTKIGLADPMQMHMVGIAMGVVGLIDFFVLPPILRRSLTRSNQG